MSLVLFTNDYRSNFSNCSLSKYADDTVIIGKITNDDCSDYLTRVHLFVEWCETNYLQLSVMETKDMIIDLMTEKNGPDLSTIDGEVIERGGLYKYLGVMIKY